MIRPTFALLSALVLAISTGRGGEQESTALLEAGYKKASELLKEQLTEALTRDEVRQSLVEQLLKSNAALNQSMADSHKFYKSEGPPVQFRNEAAAKLESITDRPPFLRQDQSDLYNRFRSAIMLRIVTLDEKGERVCGDPFEVTIPVAADPQMQWKFPTVANTIEAIRNRFVEAAKARVEMAMKYDREVLEYKRITGKK
jgi:hypothetical protein